MIRATFIDFDDSFSHNVVQELCELGLEVSVVHWLDLEAAPETQLLVLGPGPGHPRDYQRIFPLLQQWLREQKPLFGICLGHQLLWLLLGEEVVRSKEPLHGQRVTLRLDESWQDYLGLPPEVKVQRYNSLAVLEHSAQRAPQFQHLIQDGEVLATRGEKLLTYQFHPESMGTSFRRAFFRPLLRDFV
jgi:para-aminobenzoate synthetase component 2